MQTHDTAEMVASLREHIAADKLVRKIGYDKSTGKGCFIGCAERTYDASLIEARRGIPPMVTRIGEAIFEAFPSTPAGHEEARRFTLDYTNRIADGVDLSRVGWAFLADVLEHLPATADADVTDCVAESREIMLLLSGGADLADLRQRAEAAVWAAGAEATWAAGVEEAGWVAWAKVVGTRTAEVRRQADVFLRLVASARDAQ